jgi:DNA-binding NarL/FixJ family response regulator
VAPPSSAEVRDSSPDVVAPPFAAELRGRPAEAAALWSNLGCAYEAALAQASAQDPELVREALCELQRLGARVASTMIARRLRESGVHGMPRGPRPGTMANAAQLTSRQIEILDLLSQGLRNAEIADRLYVSARTVDHHVSAILTKLGARTRTEAIQHAATLGILPVAQ